MRILWTIHRRARNPYIRELSDAIGHQRALLHSELISGLARRPDIVHVNWPEELLCGHGPTPRLLNTVTAGFERCRATGCRVVWTRHNRSPHSGDPLRIRLYRIVEDAADGIIHLGTASRLDYPDPDPRRQHIIVPHGVYRRRMGCAQGRRLRRYFGIPDARPLLLAPGDCRSADDQAVVLTAARALRATGAVLLAPSLLGTNPIARRAHPRAAVSMYATRWRALFSPGLYFGGAFVSEAVLHALTAAADGVIVARHGQLNSGIPFLAAAYRLPFVAPRTGNIKEVCEGWGMPSFETGSSVRRDAIPTFRRFIADLGEYRLAMERIDLSPYSWDSIARRLIRFYHQVCDRPIPS